MVGRKKNWTTGRKIRERIRELGLSLKDVEGLTGINFCQISHYQTSSRLPSLRAFAILAKALKTTMDELAGIDITSSH